MLYGIKRQQQRIVVESHALKAGLIISHMSLVITEITNDGNEDAFTYDICVSLIHYVVLYPQIPLCHHFMH